MTTSATQALVVYRDHVVAGVPSSGANEPDKALIRALHMQHYLEVQEANGGTLSDFTTLSAEIEGFATDAVAAEGAAETAQAAAEDARDAVLAVVSTLGVMAWYDTKAALDAALGSHANGDVVGVFNDETHDGHRTIWRRVAGAWVFKHDDDAATANFGIYEHKTSVEAITVPAPVFSILVKAFPDEGGEPLRMERVGSEPPHVLKVEDASGQWWEGKPENGVTPRLCGYTGTDVIADTDAFTAAAEYIMAKDGGVLRVPGEEYVLGYQVHAGGTGQNYAYYGEDLIKIFGCSLPVRIVMDGPKITAAPNQKYGSWDPVTPNTVTAAPSNPDHYSQIGFLFDLANNADVEITGTWEYDGNVANQDIGGAWGDTGWQVHHGAVWADSNGRFRCTGGNMHHVFLDAVVLVHGGLDGSEDPALAEIGYCNMHHVGRNVVSVVGGLKPHIHDNIITHGGDNGTSVTSSPKSGIDIEAELSVIRNVVIERNFVAHCLGPQVLADQGDSEGTTLRDNKLIGDVGWAGWFLKPGFRIENTDVIGPIPWLLGDDTDATRAAKVKGGLWSMDPADSPTGTLVSGVGYTAFQTIGGGDNVEFEGTRFRATGTNTLPFSGQATAPVIFRGCTFFKSGGGTSFTDGLFDGITRFDVASGTMTFGSATHFFGPTFLNGAQVQGSARRVDAAWLASDRFIFPASEPWVTAAALETKYGVSVGEGSMTVNLAVSADGSPGWVLDDGADATVEANWSLRADVDTP